MPLSHAQTIASKGWLNDNAVTPAAKGWIYIRIEVIPPKKRGRSSGEMTKKFGKECKKVIKVTVIYNHKTFVEAKEVDTCVVVKAKDVDVKLGKDVKIEINVEGVRLSEKEIDEL